MNKIKEIQIHLTNDDREEGRQNLALMASQGDATDDDIRQAKRLMTPPEWVGGFVSDSYALGVNPLPHLRRMFPRIEWEWFDWDGNGDMPEISRLKPGHWTYMVQGGVVVGHDPGGEVPIS